MAESVQSFFDFNLGVLSLNTLNHIIGKHRKSLTHPMLLSLEVKCLISQKGMGSQIFV